MNKKVCWICGTENDITYHHVIPKIINPKQNTTIPLCKKHHKEMHNGLIKCGNDNKRQILKFHKGKNKKGEDIYITKIDNGKYCFPNKEQVNMIIPEKLYDCKIFQTARCAFANDIREYKQFKQTYQYIKPINMMVFGVRM